MNIINIVFDIHCQRRTLVDTRCEPHQFSEVFITHRPEDHQVLIAACYTLTDQVDCLRHKPIQPSGDGEWPSAPTIRRTFSCRPLAMN